MTSSVKNLKLNSIKQLIDLNGELINFALKFEVTSKDKVPFDALVVTQKMLDNGDNLEYKNVKDGTINGEIIADKGLYDNYFLLLKSSDNAECEVKIIVKEIPINENIKLEQQKMKEHQINQIEQAKNKEIQTQKENVMKKVEQKTHTARKWNFILIGLVIIIVLAVCYYFFFYKKKIALNDFNKHTEIQNFEIPVQMNNLQTDNILPQPINTPEISLSNNVNSNLLAKINSVPIW